MYCTEDRPNLQISLCIQKFSFYNKNSFKSVHDYFPKKSQMGGCLIFEFYYFTNCAYFFEEITIVLRNFKYGGSKSFGSIIFLLL